MRGWDRGLRGSERPTLPPLTYVRSVAAAEAIPSHGSPRSSNRAGTERNVHPRGSALAISSQNSGVATGAPALARTAYGATAVCAYVLRAASTSTRPPRPSLRHDVVS